MKSSTTKFLVAGLAAGALALTGCKSDTSAERTEEPATEEMDEGTGGAGTQTKQSDDNLRMPYEDPFRTPEEESIREAADEFPPEKQDEVDETPEPGTGGAGFDNSLIEDEPEELNEGGNINDDYRFPDSPADELPPDTSVMDEELDIPEGTR